MLKKLRKTDQSPSTVLIRLMVGVIFLLDGLQNLAFPLLYASEKLEKIGIQAAEYHDFILGGVEIAFSLLIIFGLYTRLAAISLIMIICFVIVTTKFPRFNEEGIWEGLEANRNEYAIFLGCVFLFIKGGGKWSLDR